MIAFNQTAEEQFGHCFSIESHHPLRAPDSCLASHTENSQPTSSQRVVPAKSCELVDQLFSVPNQVFIRYISHEV